MTFWRNYYHIIWENNQRAPLIMPSIEAPLYTFLITKADELDVRVNTIGGTENHVHIVAAIHPQLSILRVVKTLKESSDKFINEKIQPAHLALIWQSGYGCMTVGEGQLNKAIDYVKAQTLHHTDDSTNAWLEHADTIEEGPSDPGLSKRITDIIREEQPDYLEMGEPPFLT